MTKTSKTFPALLSACALLALSGQVAAQNPRLPELPSATVDVSDLDLSKPGDAEIVYERIRQAARRVCKLEHDNEYDKARLRHRNQCVDTAVENAVYRANRPLLTLVHLNSSERIAGL